MLLYIISPSFRARSFVVLVKDTDTVARIRAQLLHFLYEMGVSHFHFKLRYRDQYLRDAYNVEDYNILPNSVLVMIPLVKSYDSTSDMRSADSNQEPVEGNVSEQQANIEKAMELEIETFKLRERLVEVFRAMLWVQLLLSFLSIFTTHWYCVFWYIVLMYFSIDFCPNYCRTTGFTGKWAIYKERYCIVFITAALIVFCGDVVMEFFELRRPVIYKCSAYTYDSHCSVTVIFSGVFYLLHAVYLASMAGLCAGLFHNFKIEVGDFMERFLVQTRDVVRLLETARSGRTKDRRLAAFELASLAAAGDDNKFRIVAEGGISVLISLALSSDTATQEHAVEALVELLSIPSIQAEFVAEDGIAALTALLRCSGQQKLLRDAAVSLAYIVQESQDHQMTVVQGRGLEDLCFGAENASPMVQRHLAGIFLELAFNLSVKTVFIQNSDRTLAALTALCKSEDANTQRLGLQTLELLALDNAQCLLQKEGLLELLLDTPWRSMEPNMYVLAGRVLLYFADDPMGRDRLLHYARIREALDRFSLPKDAVLHKLVIQLIVALATDTANRPMVRELQMAEILLRIKREAVDLETGELAEQALQIVASEDEIPAALTSAQLGQDVRAETASRIAKLRKDGSSRSSLRSSHSAEASTSGGKKRN